MSSSNKFSTKAKTISKTKSVINDLKRQNEQIQIQNGQLQRNVKDLETKCEAILKTVLGHSTAWDCPASSSFAGLVSKPLPELLVKLSDLQKEQADVGTLSSRVEELETRLTSNYDEMAKLLRIKMKVESCLEQILMCRDLPEAKGVARKNLDECNEVSLFISNPEMKILNSTSKKTEKLKILDDSILDTDDIPQLIKPSKKFPGDTHISKVEPNLKKHIFYELNKETRKGNDWRLLAERVGIEKDTIDLWQEHKLKNPMANVWIVWGQSPGATVRLMHRHLISPQMKNSLLARKLSDFYQVS